MFLALRAHFTQKGYSYRKYNGKMRVSYDKFLARNDRYFFHKLSKKDDPEAFVIANLLDDDSAWVTSLINSSDADDVHTEWAKRRDSLVYTFEGDLRNLDPDFNKNLAVVDGQHPLLLEMFLEKKVCPETMVIINELTGAFQQWNKKINDEIVWPAIYHRLKKYREFMDLEERLPKLKQKVVDIFT